MIHRSFLLHPEVTPSRPGLWKGPKLPCTTKPKVRRISKTVHLSEFLLANIPPVHSDSPHRSCLPSFSAFPILGGQEKRDTPEAREWKALSPPCPLLPTTQLEGGGEVSRVHKGQMLRRKRAVPNPRPPTPPPPLPPTKEKLRDGF